MKNYIPNSKKKIINKIFTVMLYFQSFLQYFNKFLSLTSQKNKIVCKRVNLPINYCLGLLIIRAFKFNSLWSIWVHFGPLHLFSPIQSTWSRNVQSALFQSTLVLWVHWIHSVQFDPFRSILSNPVHFIPFHPRLQKVILLFLIIYTII